MDFCFIISNLFQDITHQNEALVDVGWHTLPFVLLQTVVLLALFISRTIFLLSSGGNLTHHKLPPAEKIFGVLILEWLVNWNRNNYYYIGPLSYCLSFLFLNMLNSPHIFYSKHQCISSSVKEYMYYFHLKLIKNKTNHKQTNKKNSTDSAQ